MKTIFKPLLLLLLLFFGCQPQHISNAASTHSDTLDVDSLGEDAPYWHHEGQYYYYIVSVSGLKVGGTYSKQEVLKLVGAPDRIIDNSESTMEERGYSEQWYIFPNCSFVFRDNRLDQFNINDSTFRIDKGIGVGQDTSVLRKCYHHIMKWNNDVFLLFNSETPIVIESVNGKISSIIYIPAV